jgi:hypothetical protein
MVHLRRHGMRHGRVADSGGTRNIFYSRISLCGSEDVV